jgi:hypothetical protein
MLHQTKRHGRKRLQGLTGGAKTSWQHECDMGETMALLDDLDDEDLAFETVALAMPSGGTDQAVAIVDLDHLGRRRVLCGQSH